MPAPIRRTMERAFNADFSAIRVHEGPEAPAIGALAYAQGADIHFAPGAYAPDDARGREILGHELAHTVQQAQGRVRTRIQTKGIGLNDSAALEREADVMGARAARGRPALGHASSGDPVLSIGTTGGVVQRLIHVHEVNDLFTSVSKLTKKEQGAAAQDILRRRIGEELTAILGSAYKDGAYIGKSKNIPWFIAEIERSITSDPSKWGGAAIEGIRQDVNANLLTIEEDQAREDKRELPRLASGHIKIGNEFTFTNKALRDLADKHGKKIKEAKDDNARTKAKKAYDNENTLLVEALIDRWDSYMQKYASARSDNADKKVGIVRTPGKDHKGKKVRYSLPSIDWHFDVTVDPGCVEVITPPTEATKLERGEIADAVDTYIFGVANSLGLHADPLFGGGHINIDRVQGFETQTRNLSSFLRAFLQDAKFWKGRDQDKYNAPFPDELDVAGLEKSMLGILDKYDAMYKAKDANVAMINGRLAAELIKSVFNTNIAGEDKRFSPHYQAINLEHFAEDEQAAQRVEVRRVPAQVNRATLLNELDRLFSLMNKTLVPKEPRFAGPSSPTKTWSASVSGESSKESSSVEPRPVVLSANDLAPAQGPVLTHHALVHVPILGDGNCFFNAVIRTAALNVSMANLRKELADAVQQAIDQDDLDTTFPFIPQIDAKDIVSDLRADGSYANLAGDVAPQILVAVRPTLKLKIIQSDGRVDDVGNGGTDVWLVRTSHSVDHYLATRPA
jgi:hypothetical protein